MAEKAHDEAVKTGQHEKEGKCAFIPWVLGIVVWLAIYLRCPGFLFSHGTLWPGTLWLLIPFLLCLSWMTFGLVNSCKNRLLKVPGEDQSEAKKIEYERESFKWISTYMAHLLLAITIVIPIAVYLAGIEKIYNREWRPFFLFEFLALGIAAGIILPFFWAHKRSWLILLRHIKTVSFLYMVFFFLSGLIVLALNVYNLIK